MFSCYSQHVHGSYQDVLSHAKHVLLGSEQLGVSTKPYPFKNVCGALFHRKKCYYASIHKSGSSPSLEILFKPGSHMPTQPSSCSSATPQVLEVPLKDQGPEANATFKAWASLPKRARALMPLVIESLHVPGNRKLKSKWLKRILGGLGN